MTESEGMPLAEVLFGIEPPKTALTEHELADALSRWLAEARRRAAGQRSFLRTGSTQAGEGKEQATHFPPL